jgi:hypothetical protein
MIIATTIDARAASTTALASVDGVRLLHWPADDHTRAGLDAAGVARILLVAPDAAPPEAWGDLEDWVRLPLDSDELRSRTRTLRRRARAWARPWFDGDGLLRAGDGWLDFPDGPRAVVALLVERFGELVSADELAQAYLASGGSTGASARKTMIARVRQRLTEVGLDLHNVRDAGYLLEWAALEGAGADHATGPSDERVAS